MRKITNFHLAELISILAQVDHMKLENKTWTVEIGRVMFDPSDFTSRAHVYVNGEDVGLVAMEYVQDLIMKGE